MKLNLANLSRSIIPLVFLAAVTLAIGESDRHSISETNLKEKTEKSAEAKTEKKHKKKLASVKKLREAALKAAEAGKTQAVEKKPANQTLQKVVYKDLNNTFVKTELNDFKNSRRTWDFKLLDKELEDIFSSMNMRESPYNTMKGDRPYMRMFYDQFQNCDSDGDNVINSKEFQKCVSNDTYLNKLLPPPEVFASQKNYTQAGNFYGIIFEILDSHQTGYLNFHAYMQLRLMVFSWRKCSVAGPFLEETSWECAIEVVAGFKTSSRTLLRNTFYMCLELSNSNHIRNLDFVSFLIYASSARLYGRINSKEDHDLTKSEFNLVLDENMLPLRYNQFVIDTMFKLVSEEDKNYEGIDLRTFIWYDFALRLYELPKATRRWLLNEREFTEVLSKVLFPGKMFEEISKIPMTNVTNATYQMYTYLNISNFHDEHDFLVKFAEKSSSKKLGASLRARKLRQIYNGASNAPFFLNWTAGKVFRLVDINSDGFMDWYDFGHFFSVAHLFSKFDPYQRGKITAGELYDKFTSYSEFPRVSSDLRHRAKRFQLINQDVYLDLFSVVSLLSIDDLVKMYVRNTDPSTLYEVELKRIFSKANLRMVPDSHMNKCLRGMDHLNVPKYDWECAFMVGFEDNLNYFESASNYNTMKLNNLTLVNTVFSNVDPALEQGGKKRFM